MAEENKTIQGRKNLISRIKKKKPNFKRPHWRNYARVKENWRRPKGVHSKIRERRAGKIKRVNIGYGAPAVIKGLHPNGYKEVRIHTPAQISLIDKNTQAARIGSTVGKRKKMEINKIAAEAGVKVLNP